MAADVITFPKSRFSDLPTLRVGASGPLVVDLQRRLALLMQNADLTPIAVDGKFGPSTEGAVKQFQSSQGTDPTGVVDADTWGQIVAATPMLGAPDQQASIPVQHEPPAAASTALPTWAKVALWASAVGAVAFGVYLISRPATELSNGLTSLLGDVPNVPPMKSKRCKRNSPPTAKSLTVEGQVIEKVEEAA